MHLPEVMRIFLDTADTEVIKKYYGTGLIDGITTNPTLIRRVVEIQKMSTKS